MPGFNQKGPIGEGPMTGRRMGRCTHFGAASKKDDTSTENTIEREPGDFSARGFGFGRGRGFKRRGTGFQNRFRREF
jgi:hypothetical protein